MPKKVPPAPPPAYRCTTCNTEALIRYCAGKKKGADWGGRLRKGEALCTICFRARGGVAFFG